jgi:hypothetical protein
MEARQHVWTLFYRRVMNFIGAKDVEINWPKIETEPSQRMTQALVLAHEAGALWDDEFREAIVEVLDIKKLHTTGPVADQGVADSDTASVVPSQGNSGVAGSMQDNTNDTRTQDAAPTA